MTPTTLKRARNKRKLTQAQLATAAGVDKATVFRLEAGLVSNPSYDTVKRLAEALQIDPSRLRFGAEASV